MSEESTTLRSRSAEPSPGPIRLFEAPEVAAGKLENGLSLRLAGRPRFPVAAITLVLDAGEALVGREHAGLAVITGKALEGGTVHRSGSALAEAVEGLGTELRIRTGWDSTTVSLTCLADRVDEAMGLLAEVVREPSFPAAEVERTLTEHGAMLRQRKMDPSSLASDAFLTVLYREDVPYARPLVGSVESLSRLGADGVEGFVEERYRPSRGGLVVAGDVNPSEAEELARSHFADWSGAADPGPAFPIEPERRERRAVVVHRPGAVQSEIRVGHMGAPRDTPDYYALRVANAILGGAFTSRLNLNLRERHGYTYGVRSRFSFRRGAGPFSISTAVSTEVTADAVREAVQEVRGFVEEGPRGDELEQAKDYIVGVFPLQFETAGQVAARTAGLLVYGLPDDHDAHFRERIRKVSLADVREAVERHLRPEELQILVAGDAEAVEGPLEALSLGPVEVRSE